MLSLNSTQRIYLALELEDVRKQFNGLRPAAKEKLAEDPFSGARFQLTNKQRDRVKILSWDGIGVWVAAKRLEMGRFIWPVVKGTAKVDLEPAALTMLLCGIDLKDGRKKAWYEP